MKGKNHPAEFPYHGRQRNRPPVIRMTPRHVICHRNYFYQKCFTPGMAANLFSAVDSEATGTTIYSIWPRSRPYS